MSDESNAVELYRKHRPNLWKHVYGQSAAIKCIEDMLKDKRIPHSILFTGPSGCGKTTLARILKKKLGCADTDFTELNCAKERGIDMVRDISASMTLSPLGGSCRIYLLDECHRLTGDGMSSLLKMLEDTPKHVYFFLCTTDPRKLLKTILTRCTEIKLQPLGKDDLIGLLSFICKQEGIELASDLQEKIAEVADGSARMALVLLHQVIRIKDPKEQMELIEASDTSTKAWDIVKGLLWENCTWTKMAGIINAIEGDDWEGLRRLILANATNTMLKGGKQAARAAAIANTFQYPWYDIGGKPGMILACYNVLNDK